MFGWLNNLNNMFEWKVYSIFELLNNNQGVLTLCLFILSLALGWVSGIFSALRRRPRLHAEILVGPTFCVTFFVGRKEGQHDLHRTCIALYVRLSNRGAAPTGIASINVGYHWAIKPFSMNWLKYGVGWFLLKNQSAALQDFRVEIGESVKVFPFLFQMNTLPSGRASTYLQVGEVTNGVVYFEQGESWGGCAPRNYGGYTKIKLIVSDAFGRSYVSYHNVQITTLEEARKYNAQFGETLAALSGKEKWCQ